MRKILFGTLFIGTFFVSFSQEVAPSNIAGKAMRNWLKEHWYDGKFGLLGYNYSREQMYNDIDNINGTITGVYSGFNVAFVPQESPINPVYDLGISAEHTVPQSFFNDAEPMRSDIHHLFPTYNDWNVTRSNHPFADINDNNTTKWMYLNTSTATKPTSNIDAYAESDGTYFEPREVHKGNAARAIFYFYTIYTGGIRDMADIGSIATLYSWSIQDKVNAAEQKRNDRIEYYQGNRNFFVDHPEWIAYAWGFSSPTGKPILEFTDDFKKVNSSLAVGNTFTFEVEISPAPSSTENITVSVVDSEVDPSYYTLSNTNMTFTSGTSLLTFDITFKNTLPVAGTRHIKFGLSGASTNVDLGYYSNLIFRLDSPNSIDELYSFNYEFIQNIFKVDNPKYTSYIISDNLGRTIKQGNFRNSIDLNDIENGAYFVQIFSKDVKQTVRIFKQ